MSREEPDSVLVARAQRDRAAFAPLYDRYVVAIYRYCFRLLGNREAAEDATSEALTKAIAALPRYRERAGSASFRGWLYTIAYNAAMDTHRRRPTASLGPAWEGVDSDPLPEEHAESREASADLHRRIADLTPDQQAVMHLRQLVWVHDQNWVCKPAPNEDSNSTSQAISVANNVYLILTCSRGKKGEVTRLGRCIAG